MRARIEYFDGQSWQTIAIAPPMQKKTAAMALLQDVIREVEQTKKNLKCFSRKLKQIEKHLSF